MAAIDTVSILEGNTFVVTNRRGDIDASPAEPHGFFHQDTRYLSRWILTIDGAPLNPLSVDDLDYFACQFFLVPGTGTVYVDSPLSVARRRAVGAGFHEELIVANHTPEPIDADVRIEAASDFADLFEVKDKHEKKGGYYHRTEGVHVGLGFRRDTFVRETRIATSGEGELSEHGLRFRGRIPPQGNWTTSLEVTVGRKGAHEE